MSEIRGHLKELVDQTASSLAVVTSRRMFGCDAWFARGQIFSLIWKTGRVAVRLPEEKAFAEAIGLQGADPWKVAAKMKPMAHWVLLPEDQHDDAEKVEGWVRRAHKIAIGDKVMKIPKEQVRQRPGPKKPNSPKKPKKPARK